MGCCFSKQISYDNIYKEFIKYEQVEMEFNNSFKIVEKNISQPVNTFK